jgi:hypothetical protein
MLERRRADLSRTCPRRQKSTVAGLLPPTIPVFVPPGHFLIMFYPVNTGPVAISGHPQWTRVHPDDLGYPLRYASSVPLPSQSPIGHVRFSVARMRLEIAEWRMSTGRIEMRTTACFPREMLPNDRGSRSVGTPPSDTSLNVSASLRRRVLRVWITSWHRGTTSGCRAHALPGSALRQGAPGS